MRASPVVFSRGSADRKPEFQLITTISRDGKKFTAKKTVARKAARNHIASFSEKYQLLSGASKLISPAKIVNQSVDSLEFEFVTGTSLQYSFEEAVAQGNMKTLLSVFEMIMKAIDSYPAQKVSPNKSSAEFIAVFGESYNNLTPCIQPACIDLNLDNIYLLPSKKLKLIDYEWVFDFPVPVDFIKLRVIHSSFMELLTNVINAFPDEEMITYGENFIAPKKMERFVDMSPKTIERYLKANTMLLNHIQNYQSPFKPLPRRATTLAHELSKKLSGSAGPSVSYLKGQIASQNEHISKQDEVMKKQVLEIQHLQARVHELTNTISHKTAVKAEIKLRNAVRRARQ